MMAAWTKIVIMMIVKSYQRLIYFKYGTDGSNVQ